MKSSRCSISSRDLGVDGHTISPGYEYDAAKKDMIKRLNLQPENFFLTREDDDRRSSAEIEEWMNRYTFFGTPVYFEFLAGKRDLTCSAWAIPTRNIRGWKAPCYLMTDDVGSKGHYTSYAELLEKVDWDKYGVVDGVARDPRCENCMTHCGYEPTASLGLNAKRGDTWKTVKFNFGAKPAPTGKGNEIAAYNGVTSGNGHSPARRPSPWPKRRDSWVIPPRISSRLPRVAKEEAARLASERQRSRKRSPSRRETSCASKSPTAIGSAS